MPTEQRHGPRAGQAADYPRALPSEMEQDLHLGGADLCTTERHRADDCCKECFAPRHDAHVVFQPVEVPLNTLRPGAAGATEAQPTGAIRKSPFVCLKICQVPKTFCAVFSCYVADT